ncbi:hypothetical protein PIB30_095067 [Stylosanthes scabra]|uniref:Uncharacterized protein n=1 Tax=Stylosanthes scabra TaxID=79078 RepID=A0ABU6VVP5_9FABA|nr:hypothetical protein [Stylosanthes scabra]
MTPWFADIANFKAIRMTTFFEDVFPKKNRGVCYGIVMALTMVDTSMEIGQLQRSYKVVSIGLHSSKMHSNLLRSVIDAKEQAQ